MPKEPLYPHVPRPRVVQYPHTGQAIATTPEHRRIELFDTQYGLQTIMYEKSGNLVDVKDGIRQIYEIYDGSKQVGDMTFTYSPKHKIGEVESILVNDRRKGYGRWAVEWAEDYMKKQKVSRFFVVASGFEQLMSGDVAMAFWRAMGYMPIGTPEVEAKVGSIPPEYMYKDGEKQSRR